MMSEPDPAEFTQWKKEMEEGYKEDLRNELSMLVDLSINPSEKTYRSLAMTVICNMPDMEKACKLIPLGEFNEDNARVLLVFARRDLGRIYRNILEMGQDETESRKWFDEVIDATLSGIEDGGKREVVEWNLSNLKDVKPYEPLRGI